MAAEKYSELLSVIADGKGFESNELICLPSIGVVNQEAIYVHLRSARYDRVLDLTGRILTKISQRVADGFSQTLSFHFLSNEETICSATHAAVLWSAKSSMSESHLNESRVDRVSSATEWLAQQAKAVSRKRRRSEYDDVTLAGASNVVKTWSVDSVDDFFEATILSYRADALFHLSRFDEALCCIDR